MQVYNEGFDACSGNLQKWVETKMFNIIILKGNVTDEAAYTRICTTVSEWGPQTICQNLDSLKPENDSNLIESNIFTFENVPGDMNLCASTSQPSFSLVLLRIWA